MTATAGHAQKFAGKVALVSGAGDGACRATAIAFAREGATVMVAGPDEEQLAGTVKLIRDAGGRAGSVVADVARDGVGAAARMVAATVERFGAPDFAFNDASVTGPEGPGSGTGLVEVDWVVSLAAHLTGLFAAMKHELAPMEARGSGVIVNTALAVPRTERLIGRSAYAGYAAALTTLTATAAAESADLGVRIAALDDGAATAEELAERVLRLCSDPSGDA
ncbi:MULTISPECIES: SDR family NAD(P)-dependent oxidoreductase [unclassified Streptomyces]|uniref:SDR family NAD(P)-dependent oxidoreductase n=1 Tax=unclassified Streptomyces TaxID=2593676 RepID=UPI002253C196|nr:MULTISPECIES: SDR family NAD(P)-dependent oxidoreductase [unclassified Streptomyces]MCX4526972.1 SDR family NAD(P)-dependent oxidoreductase [Streptomyces sp. NBC_01551]MCX4542468.1 SDR family NAD(P)-dependent oxidoreductase [Streptomyces sp. NBC_01565]